MDHPPGLNPAWAEHSVPAVPARSLMYLSCAVSQNIQVARFDHSSGQLTPCQTVALGARVMPLALSPDRRFLFAALRSAPYAVAVFAIDAQEGLLSPLGRFLLPGSMASIATDRSGRLLLAASYGSGLLSVSHILATGEVLPAHQIIPTPPLAHMIQASLDNRFVYATSLGGDAVLQFALDAGQGSLQPLGPPALALPAGSGPRHLAFHPDGRFLYILDELDARLHCCRIDAASGALSLLASHVTLPAGFTGQAAGADIHLTPDGRFLYTSERASCTLAGFRVAGASGELSLIGHWSSEVQPRGFNIDPSGRYLLEAGQISGLLGVHRICADGRLEKCARYPVGEEANWIELCALSG